ncbi:hypothetical protein LWP59_24840 [Amycolatopsis acidiphila]|uniref:Uncharacterized protein n=1 Tax=Amycolatopsis acidiphila TaxID=715473 RepID=A0A558ACG7_9PSEU|nr:hypothetical protein [Amycolatopsis acidiphila]TVT21947.1 hypothetical protein FNH06_15460 [Amycolatopsis acidiphila]UIJ57371.1 hypothetical protein LWP59_24840 [Amycolatopsis acidiphila]GHG84560.1 hypothetical protein GCM10017788_56710 [Amycolatopsis acidiphila]
MTEPEQLAGPEFAAFVREQLEVEEKRRASLETRSLAVITTSGTLVTLVLGLAALVTQRKDFTFPHAASPWLLASLVIFVLATVFAIVANSPRRHHLLDTTTFEEIIRRRWSTSADDAVKTLAVTRLRDLERVQRVNNVKGWLLLAAVAAQGCATASLAVTVGLLLTY